MAAAEVKTQNSEFFQSKTNTDFNYPMPNRRDLMSNLRNSIKDVTTYENFSKPIIQQQKRDFRSSSLFTGDIDGAQSQIRAYKFTNKESFINRCDDIIDKKKQQLYRESRIYQDQNLPGTKPQILKFNCKRSTNPICPDYQLPSYSVQEPPEPKFLKDPLEIDDIEGTRKKKDPWYNYQRNIDPYTEIEGSKPKVQKIYKDKVCSLKINDISTKRWKSQKNTNPLEPVYAFRTKDNKELDQNYGEIYGTKNKPSIDLQKKPTSFNLSTQDIRGAQADYVMNTSLLMKTRKEFRDTNQTKDIPGAQVGSKLIRKQLQTNRHVNPLRPDYLYPGHSEKIDEYGITNSKEQKEIKIHDQLQKLPEIKSQLAQQQQQQQNQQPRKASQQSHRSRRSQTSNAVSTSKQTVAQQLDQFINK